MEIFVRRFSKRLKKFCLNKVSFELNDLELDRVGGLRF